MTISYEETTNHYGDEIVIKSDGDVRVVFTKDPANADYQAYLRWLSGEDENQGGLN